MRPRSREINIFNMSLLDVLTGALGAFLFLALGLIPYYTAHGQPSSSGSGGAEEGLRRQIDELQQKIRDLEADRAKAEEMMTILLQWDDGTQDVDLWVHPPGGDWNGPKPDFSPRKKAAFQIFDAKPAIEKTAFASEIQPSRAYEVEAFAAPLASGEYLICARLAQKQWSGKEPVVSGWVVVNTTSVVFTYRLPTQTLSEEGRVVPLARFVIPDDKNFQNAPLQWMAQLSDTDRQRLIGEITRDGGEVAAAAQPTPDVRQQEIDDLRRRFRRTPPR